MDVFLSIVLATAGLWVLDFLVVLPLAKYSAKLKGVKFKNLKDISTYYILADIFVLGILGLVFGAITGTFFIGLSFRKEGWPGMLIFIALSFIGATVLYQSWILLTILTLIYGVIVYLIYDYTQN